MSSRSETVIASETVRIYLKIVRAKISIVLEGFYQSDLERELSEDHVYGLKEIIDGLEDDLEVASKALSPIVIADEHKEYVQHKERMRRKACSKQ